MKTKTLKLKLILGCSLQVLMSQELSAQFNLEDFDPTQHQAQYNSLPTVVESDQKLQQSPQFQECLNEAAEIITRYEFNDFMGLSLIHRHFSLGTNQIMVQKYEIVENVPSLVTQAYTLEEAKEMNALPSSWIFSNSSENDVLLFEASSDPAVIRARSALEKSPEFFDEMGKAIGKYQLKNLIGLGVLSRDSLIAHEGQNYTEINSYEQSRSIVKLWNINDIPPNSIRTSWSFNGPQKAICGVCNNCVGHL